MITCQTIYKTNKTETNKNILRKLYTHRLRKTVMCVHRFTTSARTLTIEQLRTQWTSCRYQIPYRVKHTSIC